MAPESNQSQLVLPALIVSPGDMSRMRRELTALDDPSLSVKEKAVFIVPR